MKGVDHLCSEGIPAGIGGAALRNNFVAPSNFSNKPYFQTIWCR
uniref:Uncharacterized protein n=1 Tax=Arundo donax TaxID=35708 RepID=A0A0A9BWZ4_ARUDO